MHINNLRLNYGPRRETAEGVEMTFCQNFLSRYLVIDKLVPLLAKKKGRVVSCLAAGNGSAINREDPQLKSTSSWIPYFISCAGNQLYNPGQHASMNDVMVKEFSKRFYKDTGVSFFHLFPGTLKLKP